jgi:hypothetical protein
MLFFWWVYPYIQHPIRNISYGKNKGDLRENELKIFSTAVSYLIKK